MSRCGIVILAAGGSSRMGRPKQLLPLDGTSLLVRAATNALQSQCRPVVVVVGAGAETMRRELAGLDIQIVVNSSWESGIRLLNSCGSEGGGRFRNESGCRGDLPVRSAVYFRARRSIDWCRREPLWESSYAPLPTMAHWEPRRFSRRRCLAN